jgi:DnaJ-domain-containing protein 1
MSRYGLPSREVDAETDRASARSDAPTAPRAHPVARDGLTTQKRKVSAVQARVIDAMYESLRELDHRAVLSVCSGADPLEIRCAYESLLAAFHPRRFEQTCLGEHREKLEAILRRIHEAYEALSTESERDSHDARFGRPER